MRSLLALRLAAWLLLLLGGVAVLRSATGGVVAVEVLSAVPGPPATPVLASPRTDADSLAKAVIGGDIFRATRKPAPLPYSPDTGADRQPPHVTPPKPQLRLVGIVTGRQAAAIVEGFPGKDRAIVVRAGEELGNFLITAIGDSTVEIIGMDTVWVLTVREPWKD